MIINFDRGVVHIDNMRFCFYEVPNGSKDLQPGHYSVEARYAHAFGKVLPFVADHGWIGDDARCAIVLGKVRGRANVAPHEHPVALLVERIEAAYDAGIPVLAEIV